LASASASAQDPVTTQPVDPQPAEETEPISPPTTTNDRVVEALEERVEKLEAELIRMRREQTEQVPTARPVPDVPEPEPEPEPKPEATQPTPSTKERASADPDFNRPPDYADGFHFGSYGRVMAGGDHKGRPGRDGDIVSRGSRLDESTYVELELRREDYWEATDSYTRIVALVAFAHPLFHYNSNFDANMGFRNLYIESSGLGLDNLRIWAGSRMYRGDDIYLLDFWPLDNLNTVGGGLAYTFLKDLELKLHTGINQPDHPFFYQTAQRPLPLNQLGDTQVAITDRQKFISSGRLSNIFWLGDKGAGFKPVVYGEVHYVPKAQQEIRERQFEDLPDDFGWLVGAQLGVFTGRRSTHLNLVARYASGLAAHGEFNAPVQLGPDRTSKGAREILFALSGNYEKGPFGLLVGSYWRSFRNGSPGLDFGDLGEGILIARPTVWLGQMAGVSVEGSYQAQRRGVLLEQNDGSLRPQFGQMGRIGLVPFLTPAGRGNFARPHIRLVYLLSLRDEGARRLYPEHDVFAMRAVDHYFGLGAEWWFGSTSYFRD
jgi:hypothetical protein